MSERDVFVVHGRNLAARDAMFEFLRSLDLCPLEWEDMVAATGQGSPYVGDVLKKGLERAQAIVVLLAGDDEARLREPLWAAGEPAHECELTPQPRPNVLIEAGMALGLSGDQTIIVELGPLDLASDLFGRHTVRLNDTPEKRRNLIARLKSAGCPLKDTGADWLRAGEFDAAILPATSTGASDEAVCDAELSEDEKDLLLWMLYNGGRMISTSAGPQPEHLETDSAALYDPSDLDVAVRYRVSFESLRERGLVSLGSAGDSIARFYLTGDGKRRAAELREAGRRQMDVSGFPRPHSGRSLI